MNTFIKLNSDEIAQWQRYSTLKSMLLRWQVQSLASYEAAVLNQQRLKHLENMDQFDTVDYEIQNILRFPFLTSSSDHFKKYTEEKFKAEGIKKELLELKNKLKI